MAYTPQTWADGDPTKPVSAARMTYIESGISNAHAIASAGGSLLKYIFLDSYTGTDDQKLTSAIAAQQAQPNMTAIVLGARQHDFNVTRTLYSGLKIIGQGVGPKNTEQNRQFVGSWIKLGAAITNGAGSWWIGNGANLFDIYMGDFAVEGNGSNQQFIDVNTGTLYACQFHSLAFNYMFGCFGSNNRLCALTQVVFSGHWTVNNIVGTNFWIGGSDNSLWMNGYINIGTGSSTALYADPAAGFRYQIVFSGLSNTNVGYIYISALNGYRGLRIMGNSGNGIMVYGGVFEGYKATGTQYSGPAPGTVIRIEGGSGAFFGPNVGQGMAIPFGDEAGLVQVTGGEWSIYTPEFYRGSMAETVPCIAHTGGRLMVTGANHRQSESWTGRPRYATTATPGTGGYTFYCPDQSMTA